MTPPATYQELILSRAGLLGYWPLDATSLATDLSGLGHNGTAQGGVTLGGATGPGDALTATDFDGSNDWVSTTYNPFTNGTIRSYEFWAKRDTSVNQHAVLGGDGASNIAQITLEGGSNDIKWRPGGGIGSGSLWTAAWVGTAQWAHGMVIFNETTNDSWLYINGTLISNQPTADQYQGTGGNFAIGQLKGGTSPFDGKLAHIAIYNLDASAYAKEHWSWGISTFASRNPIGGLPNAASFFPSQGILPTGETLGATP